MYVLKAKHFGIQYRIRTFAAN